MVLVGLAFTVFFYKIWLHMFLKIFESYESAESRVRHLAQHKKWPHVLNGSWKENFIPCALSLLFPMVK